MSAPDRAKSKLPLGKRIVIGSIAVATSLTASFICDATCRHYAWTDVVSMTRRIERDVNLMDGFGHDDIYLFPEQTINAWLAGDISDYDPLDMIERELDAWGNPYRCRRNIVHSDGTVIPVGIYSTGKDGVTQSDGNDRDDINTWDPDSYSWYQQQVRRSILIERVIVAAFPALVVYVVLAAMHKPSQRVDSRNLPADEN